MGFKARGQRRRVRSDWMAAPRERGISVSSAVMSFEHEELAFNLLDTPGHQRFQPKRIFGDTYRTLTAVPPWRQGGIEEQTRKFFEVCRLRDVPIITFINKLDREGRDPFDLLDEIEQSLALDVTPASWPIVPKTRASIEAVAAGPQVKNYVARTACPSICWRPEPYGAWRSFEMKHVALAVMVALATLVLSQTSRAAVCANGVYRAGLRRTEWFCGRSQGTPIRTAPFCLLRQRGVPSRVRRTAGRRGRP